jgi:sugar lactone lactonase YvrE
MTGQIVAGGNGRGDGPNQLNNPTDVMVDKETNSLIICDRENRRVVQWSLQNGTTSGKVLLSDILCFGLTMDNQRFLYVTDVEKHEVKRYRMGETTGTLVAGGNGQGKHLSQLNKPEFVFVDETYSVYVSDYNNDRVMKWVAGATEGIMVAGSEDYGTALTQLGRPTGLFVDSLKTVYVVEGGNHRVTRWLDGAQQGELIVGRNQRGSRADQLNCPNGLPFDRQGNLYVVDYFNNRVQRYSIGNS